MHNGYQEVATACQVMANNVDSEQVQETSRAIKLQSLTTWDDGKRITRVALLIADDADCSKRTEWLDAQISVELPITRNGALLREEVLTLLRNKLEKLAADFGRLVRP